jgi:hypothetical protein
MSSFTDREPGVEGKVAPEQALEFRAVSRRNHMLGEWAGRLMELDNVEAYARAVLKSEIDQPSDEDVLRKVSQDLTDSGLSVPRSEILSKMDEFLAISRGQLKAGE